MTSQDAGVREGSGQPPEQRIDTSVPHPARRYNYWLGGKDHFEADRASGDEIARLFPTVRIAALENRAFLRRAVSTLTELGVRQFIDIGCGIPAPGNTHEVAQAIAPTSRVVYIDNDPIVMTHARALLNSGPEGATAYIEGDVRQGNELLSHPDLLRTIDLSQPVALLLIAVLHFVGDDEDPYGLVAGLTSALPAGSYLAMSHGSTDALPPQLQAMAKAAATTSRHGAMSLRSAGEIARFFEGMELLEPGIVSTCQWRADDEPGPRPTPAETAGYAAIARIP